MAGNISGGETPSPDLIAFRQALGRLPDGYVDGSFNGRPWGVTIKRSKDGRRVWLYGEQLGGTEIVSFNLYRLARPVAILKPCEMSSTTVTLFVLAFEPHNSVSINKLWIFLKGDPCGCGQLSLNASLKRMDEDKTRNSSSLKLSCLCSTSQLMCISADFAVKDEALNHFVSSGLCKISFIPHSEIPDLKSVSC